MAFLHYCIIAVCPQSRFYDQIQLDPRAAYNMFDLILYIPSTLFHYKGTGLPGLNQYSAKINVLAQGHNAVRLVRLEPAAPWSLPLSHCTPYAHV